MENICNSDIFKDIIVDNSFSSSGSAGPPINICDSVADFDGLSEKIENECINLVSQKSFNEVSSDYEDATNEQFQNGSHDAVLNEIMPPQKAVSPTIFENAVKAVKNLFSPVKGHGIFSLSQSQVKNKDVPIIKSHDNKENMISVTTSSGFEQEMATADKLSPAPDACQIVCADGINDSGFKNSSNGGDPHDNTNDSYTTTVSRMDDSFQSTVTHFDECIQNDGEKLNEQTYPVDDGFAFNGSFNDTLGINDNSLDDTLKRNHSVCSLENQNINATLEVPVEGGKPDENAENPGVKQLDMNIFNITVSDKTSDIKCTSEMTSDVGVLDDTFHIEKATDIAMSSPAEKVNETYDIPGVENIKNDLSANNVSDEGAVTNDVNPSRTSFTDIISQELTDLPLKNQQNPGKFVKSWSVEDTTAVDSHILNELPITKNSSETNCSRTSGRNEDALMEKIAACKSPDLEKNFSTSTIVISNNGADMVNYNITPDIHSSCNTLSAADDELKRSHSSPNDCDRFLQRDSHNNSITSNNNNTTQSSSTNVFTGNNSLTSFEVAACARGENIKETESTVDLGDPHEFHSPSEKFDTNVTDRFSDITSNTELDVENSSDNLMREQNENNLKSLTDPSQTDETGILLASQKSYTLLHNTNPELNRPVVVDYNCDVHADELNDIIFGNAISDINDVDNDENDSENDTIVKNSVPSPRLNNITTTDLTRNIFDMSKNAGNLTCLTGDPRVVNNSKDCNDFMNKIRNAPEEIAAEFDASAATSFPNEDMLIDCGTPKDNSKFAKNEANADSATLKMSDGETLLLPNDVLQDIKWKSVSRDAPETNLGAAIENKDQVDFSPTGTPFSIADGRERNSASNKSPFTVNSILPEVDLKLTNNNLIDTGEKSSCDEAPNSFKDQKFAEIRFANGGADNFNVEDVLSMYQQPRDNDRPPAIEALTGPNGGNALEKSQDSKNILNSVNNLVLDLEKLKINDNCDGQKVDREKKNAEMDFVFNTFGGYADSLAAGDESGLGENFKDMARGNLLGNDTELTQLIQEQFTAVDIEKICSVVDDMPELNLSKNIVMASQQFDKSFQDKVLNENSNATDNNLILNKDNYLGTACLDFLDSIKGKPTGRDFSRESLYVKFDPLVQSKYPTGLLDIAEGDKENLIVSPVSKNNTSTDSLIPITPLNKALTVSSPLSALTPPSQKNESRLSAEKLNKLRELQSEILRLREFYLQREEINKEKVTNYENEIAKLTGRACLLEDKLKESEEREKALVKKLTSDTESINRLKKIIEEYLSYISKLTDQLESVRLHSQKQVSVLQEERDYYMKHLQSTEQAFSDVHSKYEKCKKAVEIFKKNEECYRTNIEELKDRVEHYSEKIKDIQESASREINNMYDKVNDMKSNHTQEISRFKAQLRKTELKVQTVQEALEQKVKENQELAGICDELIQGKK